MLQSKLFTKTLREAPKDEESVNAKLLIRAGFIHKEMAGVYDYMPLGLRVIEKIKQIVREEMNTIEGQEFIMSSLQRKEIWEKTDRWSDEKVDVWFKSNLKNGSDVYNKAIEAYKRVFERVGLGDRTFLTFASGGAFTQFSHEFQTLTDAGEDVIYLDRKKKIAINKEVYTKEVMDQLGVKESDLEEVVAAEVGNIFNFGGSKSEQLGLMFKDESGDSNPVILGSYGIGISRVMGVLVEIFHDDKGIIWPKEVAPFDVHLIELDGADNAEKIYKELNNNGIEVLWDNRSVGAGEKFADSDLIGIPVRLVVSKKTGDKIEWKERTSDKSELLSLEELIKKLKK
jgi:prolyl-tRNA synthetase